MCQMLQVLIKFDLFHTQIIEIFKSSRNHEWWFLSPPLLLLIFLLYITLNPLHLSHNSLQVLVAVQRWVGAREGREVGVGGCCVVDETCAHTLACFPGCSGINCGKLNVQIVHWKHECLWLVQKKDEEVVLEEWCKLIGSILGSDVWGFDEQEIQIWGRSLHWGRLKTRRGKEYHSQGSIVQGLKVQGVGAEEEMGG